MMRKSVRAILAGGIAAAAVVATASPAAAKGCGPGGCPPPVKIRVTVTGLDLTASIVIRGPDGWSMLNVSGAKYRSRLLIDDVPAELGPRYQAVYEFLHRGKLLGRLRQDLFPYAAGRPFAYTPEGQEIFDGYWEPIDAAKGWRGSRTLQWILQEHGLPEAPPAGATTSAAGVVAIPGGDDGDGPPPWAWVAAGAALLSLGGIAARRRHRRRSAGAPA
jgi:hypothetical protein